MSIFIDKLKHLLFKKVVYFVKINQCEQYYYIVF